MVKKFVTKFKNYKMPKGVRLLNYEVDLWEKKISDTKEALASDVKEVKNGSTVTTNASELPKEVNAVVTGINSNASVFLATSPGSITCSHCGSVRDAGIGVEVHKAQVHERSSKADGTNEDLKKLKFGSKYGLLMVERRFRMQKMWESLTFLIFQTMV